MRSRIIVGVITLVLLASLAGWAGSLPPGGNFIDDDGNTHESAIEAIRLIGVTLGCNPAGDRYCPSEAVRRDQMASFLARALGLPDTDEDYFEDDTGNTHEDNINKIAEAAITLGDANGDYNPNTGVTRAQMVSFLARALGLPDTDEDYFEDDNGNTHEDNINKIAEAAITLGDANGDYNPDTGVTRAQMASFLARALGLPDTDEDYFEDDTGNTHEDNINKIAEAAITLGDANGDYNPNTGVTRAQMASFLARALLLTARGCTTPRRSPRHSPSVVRLLTQSLR